MIELTILSQVSNFYRNLNLHQNCREQKKHFQAILVIIFWNFIVFQYRSQLPQVKQNLIFSITNAEFQLPQELPNNLRFRIIEKLRNIGKILNLGGDIASAQSPFQKLIFGNSNQKACESRYQDFFALPNIAGLLYFLANLFVQDCKLSRRNLSLQQHNAATLFVIPIIKVKSLLRALQGCRKQKHRAIVLK